MLSRLAMLLIVVFWLVMTALQIERRFYPERFRLSQVPPTHVANIFFQQNQFSDLTLFRNREEVGFLRIGPKPNENSPVKTVALSGAFRATAGIRQQFQFTGYVDLGEKLAIKRVVLEVFINRSQRASLLVDKETGEETFSIGEVASEERVTYPLTFEGFSALMRDGGMNPDTLPKLKKGDQSMPPLECTAQESSVRINNETMGTYLLTLRMGEQIIVELHLSQIGQIMRADIPLLQTRMLPQGVAYQ